MKHAAEYNGHRIYAMRHGVHGFSATAVPGSWDMARGFPSASLRTECHQGKGAKAKAIQAARELIDRGYPPALVWTVRDDITGATLGEVEAPSRGTAEALARYCWAKDKVRTRVDPEPQERPHDWNAGIRFKRFEAETQ